MLEHLIERIKNNLKDARFLLVAFFCACLASPIPLAAKPDPFNDDGEVAILPPLRKTLSAKGAAKAEALALFARGYDETRKERRLTRDAEKLFLDSLRLYPDLNGPLRILIAQWTRERKPEKLVENLLPIAKRHPDAVNLNIIVANTLRIIDRSDDALRLIEKSFEAFFNDDRRDEDSDELKTKRIKILFNLLDLLAEKKLWTKGEGVLETAFAFPETRGDLTARLAAAQFYAKCADLGPDGFFAGWDKRRRRRALEENLAAIENLCAAESAPASTLLAVCGIFKRYSMPSRAEKLVLAQLLRDPNSPLAMLVLARTYDMIGDHANEMRVWKVMLRSNRFNNIKKAWSKISGRDGSSTELYFQLGLAALKANDWGEALAAFDWRLLNAPNDTATIFQIGVVQMRMGKLRKALYQFEKLDDLPYALYFAAICHKALGELDQAFEKIAEAERLAKKLKFVKMLNENFYIEYAIIADKVGEFEITRTILETLLKNNPESAMLNNFLAYALAEKGVELRKAEGLVSKALKKEPDNEAYLDTLAWIRYKLNRLGEAEELIEKALRASDGVPDAVVADHAGDIKLARGKIDEAVKYWKLAEDTHSRELNYELVAAKIAAVAHRVRGM